MMFLTSPSRFCARAFLAASLLGLFSTKAIADAWTPTAPDLAARGYALYDYKSGVFIAEKLASEPMEPASITKLMTAYLAFKALKAGTIKMDDTPAFSQKGWKIGGSLMFIDPKKPATVRELLQGMIVASGNDATITLAEAIAGSEDAFVQMMNKEAARLGLKKTNFMNSTGMPDAKHYSTAHDLSLLGAAIIRDYPEHYHFYSQKEFTHNNIKQPNRNLLLFRDPTVDGMKTGHTESAGYCLVSSAHRGDRRLISVVLGTASMEARAVESQKLLNYGMQVFDSAKLFSAKQSVKVLSVYQGASSELPVGFMRDIYVSIPRGEAKNIKTSLQTTQPLLAPISANQQVGKLTVSLSGRVIGEYPVVALQTVAQAGWFGRTWDRLRLWWKS